MSTCENCNRLRDANKALMAAKDKAEREYLRVFWNERDAQRRRAEAAEAKLAKVEAAFVEQAKMLKTSTDAGLETLAANTRLSAELAEARNERDTLAALAYWFRKWPEFKPSPEFAAQLQNDLSRATPFIPTDRLASKEARRAD